MTRTTTIILAGLALGLPGAAAAQNGVAPAHVLTPAPPPREGTVGPEQLRDFALPGTRQGSTPPAEVQRPVPAPAPRTTPPATASRPAPVDETRTEPRDEPSRPAAERPTPAEITRPDIASAPPPATPAGQVPLPLSQPAEALPPIVVTQAGAEQPSLLPGWWPWLLVAMLGSVGLALFRRQRSRPAVAGHRSEEFERVAHPPAPPAPRHEPQPQPAPPAPLPTGLVTTRLRSPAPPVPAPAPPAPAPVTGGVVSRRLRGWVEIDLVVREILFDADQALLRVDLIIGNGGTASARDIALEAVTTNAGEDQATELAAFFERPAGASVAIVELGPLSDTTISHELRMPRSAIRAYEAQGRTLFVPVIAISAVYRSATGEGRTGAAFLAGREIAGSDKLSPLLLPEGAGRQLGLGVRRLDEAIRR